MVNKKCGKQARNRLGDGRVYPCYLVRRGWAAPKGGPPEEIMSIELCITKVTRSSYVIR